MYIKYIPLAEIRSAAMSSSATWESVEKSYAANQVEETVSGIDKILGAFRKVDLQAITTLIVWIRHGLTAPAADASKLRGLILPAMSAVRREIDQLVASEISSTLHLHEFAKEIAVAVEMTTPPAADFFLPSMPSATFEEDTGEFKTAAAVYAKPFRQAVVNYAKHPGNETLAELRSNLIALENRALPSNAGFLSSLALALVDDAIMSSKPLQKSDLSQLLLMANAFRDAVEKNNYKIDYCLISRMAYRVSTLKTSRARLITKRYSLEGLHAANTNSVEYALPDKPAFAVKWQESVKAWDEYVAGNSNKIAAGVFGTSLTALAKACAPNEDLVSMAEGLQKLFTEIAAGKVQAHPKALNIFVTDYLALMNDALESGDAEFINAEAKKSSDLVAQSLEDKYLAIRTDSDVTLPIKEMMHEVIVEIAKVSKQLKDGLLTEAKSTLQSSFGTLELLIPMVPAAADFTVVSDLIGQAMGSIDRRKTLSFLDMLRQALEVFSLDEPAAQSLLDDIKKGVDTAAKAAKSEEGLPHDKPSDDEIFEIFHEEAKEVCEAIFQQLTEIEKVGSIDSDAAKTLRRHFHTLKGSAKMCGLRWVGEGAWVIEQAMNFCISKDHMPLEYVAISRKSAEMVLEACEAITSNGFAMISVSQYEDLILHKGNPPEKQVPEEAATQAPLSTPPAQEFLIEVPPASEPVPASPISSGDVSSFSLPTLDPSALDIPIEAPIIPAIAQIPVAVLNVNTDVKEEDPEVTAPPAELPQVPKGPDHWTLVPMEEPEEISIDIDLDLPPLKPLPTPVKQPVQEVEQSTQGNIPAESPATAIPAAAEATPAVTRRRPPPVSTIPAETKAETKPAEEKPFVPEVPRPKPITPTKPLSKKAKAATPATADISMAPTVKAELLEAGKPGVFAKIWAFLTKKR